MQDLFPSPVHVDVLIRAGLPLVQISEEDINKTFSEFHAHGLVSLYKVENPYPVAGGWVEVAFHVGIGVIIGHYGNLVLDAVDRFLKPDVDEWNLWIVKGSHRKGDTIHPRNDAEALEKIRAILKALDDATANDPTNSATPPPQAQPPK